MVYYINLRKYLDILSHLTTCREVLQEDREGRLHSTLDEELYKAKRRRYSTKQSKHIRPDKVNYLVIRLARLIFLRLLLHRLLIFYCDGL